MISMVFNSKQVIEIIDSWDYHRDIPQSELENAIFFEIGLNDGYFWIQEIPVSGVRWVAIHIIINPDRRKRVFNIVTWRFIKKYVSDIGYDRLYALNPTPVMLDMVKRLRFKQDDKIENWYYYEVDHG